GSKTEMSLHPPSTKTTANIAIKSNGLNALNKKITILPIDVVNLKCTFSKSFLYLPCYAIKICPY
ncbi:hypothetical protein SB780_35945, partial [Burkholderia sp. SIMBA_057]